MTAIDWTGPFTAPEPGQRFRSEGRTIALADMACFAALTGDWHPRDLAPPWDAKGRLRWRVTHGLLLASFAVALVPLDPERIVALANVHDVAFEQPVKLGQTIYAEACVVAVKAVDDELGLVDLRWEIVDEHHESVCRAGIELLWSSRPAERAGALHGAIGIDYPPGVLPC